MNPSKSTLFIVDMAEPIKGTYELKYVLSILRQAFLENYEAGLSTLTEVCLFGLTIANILKIKSYFLQTGNAPIETELKEAVEADIEKLLCFLKETGKYLGQWDESNAHERTVHLENDIYAVADSLYLFGGLGDLLYHYSDNEIHVESRASLLEERRFKNYQFYVRVLPKEMRYEL